jgi:hypothetical protein
MLIQRDIDVLFSLNLVICFLKIFVEACNRFWVRV